MSYYLRCRICGEMKKFDDIEGVNNSDWHSIEKIGVDNRHGACCPDHRVEVI